jgi:hypothetical protein
MASNESDLVPLMDVVDDTAEGKAVVPLVDVVDDTAEGKAPSSPSDLERRGAATGPSVESFEFFIYLLVISTLIFS